MENTVITQKLISLIQLLDRFNNPWAGKMKKLLDNYLNLTESTNKQEAAKLIINSMLGGMNSLSDVVLHKNKILVIKENNELNKLLDELYLECKSLQ
jgi:hypothetical protein